MYITLILRGNLSNDPNGSDVHVLFWIEDYFPTDCFT